MRSGRIRNPAGCRAPASARQQAGRYRMYRLGSGRQRTPSVTSLTNQKSAAARAVLCWRRKSARCCSEVVPSRCRPSASQLLDAADVPLARHHETLGYRSTVRLELGLEPRLAAGGSRRYCAPAGRSCRPAVRENAPLPGGGHTSLSRIASATAATARQKSASIPTQRPEESVLKSRQFPH